MVKKYIPDQGDICYVDISPTVGHEQNGYRPVLVLSPRLFSIKTGMTIICPITSNTKSFNLHYELQNTSKIYGCVECEHLRSLDYLSRTFKFIERLDVLEYVEIVERVFPLIDLNYNSVEE